MGAGVAVGADRVLTAHYLVLGASDVEVTGVDGKRARRAPRRASTTRRAWRSSPSTGRRCGRPASGTGDDVAPGVPVFLLTCRQARAQGRHRPRLRGRAVRGLLGVHARPRDHDDRHQPRPGRRAPLRRGRRGSSASSRWAWPRSAATAWPSRSTCTCAGARTLERDRRAPRAARLDRHLPAGLRRRRGAHRRRAGRTGRPGRPRPRRPRALGGRRRPSASLRELYPRSGGAAPGESLEPPDPARRRASAWSRSPPATATSSIAEQERDGHPQGRPHRPSRDPRAPRAPLTGGPDRAPPTLQRLIDDMVDTMHEYDGVGLAGAAGARRPAAGRDRGAGVRRAGARTPCRSPCS